MPVVPVPQGPQVAPGGAAQGRLVAPEASGFGARQTQVLGQTLEGVGSEAAKVALDMRVSADELRVTEALNRYKERQLTLQYDKDVGFVNVKGKDAFDRPDGRSLADAYGEQLGNSMRDIAGGLGDDRQRALFVSRASGMLTSFKGAVKAHEAGEYKTYELSVSDGVQATALRDIELNWRDPNTVDAAVTRIRAEVYRQATMTGKSAEWQEAQARKMASNGLKVALMAALDQGDPMAADSRLKRYADQMEGGDILAVKSHITKAVNTQIGMGVASEYAARASQRLVPTDMDRAFEILKGTESNNRQFAADGKPLTSAAGAVGVAQVMPGTGPAAAKMAGMQWDENRYRTDPVYNAALGRAYFGQQIKDFDGDLGKAYAAYNAGPRWVKEAETRAAKAEPGTQQADWFWQLNNDARTPDNRAQTQNYVTKNLREYEAGGGVGARPTFADIDAALRADPRLAGDPERLKVARQEAKRQFGDAEDAMKQRSDETVATAMRALVANGGRYVDLPPALRAALPPKEIDNVMGFAEKMAKGQQPNTDWGLYYELSNDPELLKRTNLMAVRDKLADTEFKHLTTLQQKDGKDQNLTALQSPMALVTQFAREAGISTSGTNKADAEKLGRITSDVQSALTAAEQAKGKKLAPEEVRQVVARAFVKVEIDRPYWFNQQAPAALVKPDDRLVVPVAERAKIADALKRAGRQADEASIQTLYRQHLGIR